MGKFISFDQLCGGAALERFNLAMAQIAKNIMAYLTSEVSIMPEAIRERITIIG